MSREIVQIVEKFDLIELIKKHIDELGIDDSFFITDVGDVVRKFILWRELFPRIYPDFAIKSNNRDAVASTLAALGTGFDCASIGEMIKVLNYGVDPDKIVFAQTVKPIHHLKFAKEKNVRKMTFDNECELEKIGKHFPTAKLLLRLGFKPKSTAKISFGEKFGCTPEIGKELLKRAKELNLDACGVAFHIGMGFQDYQIFEDAINDSAEMFEFGKSLGFKMDLLDIGGGFPGHETKTIRDLSIIINKSIEKYFPDPEIKIISEPGQFFATSSMILVVNVHSKSIKMDQNGEKVYHYYITDGTHQSFSLTARLGMHPNPLKIKVLRETTGEKLKKSLIWGRTCDPNDRVESEIYLPELNCGDWLIFEDLGGYRTVTSSEFNGFPQHPIFNYIDKEMWKKFNDLKLSNVNIQYEIQQNHAM